MSSECDYQKCPILYWVQDIDKKTDANIVDVVSVQSQIKMLDDNLKANILATNQLLNLLQKFEGGKSLIKGFLSFLVGLAVFIGSLAAAWPYFSSSK